MSDEGPSAPPFFRPAAPKRSNQGSNAAEAEQHRAIAPDASQVDERPVLPARPPSRRSTIQHVNWTDAFRIYKMILALPQEMQQAIIEAVRDEQ